MSELTCTTRQQWHAVILNHLVQAGDWAKPQNVKGVKFDRLNELEDYGMIEKSIDRNTGAAPASIYRITKNGLMYHNQLKTRDLFNTDDGVSFYQLWFYLISGDMKEIFPYVIEFLQGDNSQDNKNEVVQMMLRSGNGFMYVVAQMFLNDNGAVYEFDPAHTIDNSWTERGQPVPYKAVNMRLSQVGKEALEKVVERMEEIGLRPALRGHTASEGFALELAIIILSTHLDDFLPVQALQPIR